jgi:hypothetical protein
MLAHGLLRRVRTIQIAVRPLGGNSFKITPDAPLSTVQEAKKRRSLEHRGLLPLIDTLL